MNNSQTIDFSISVPGKVILHGEHSVVYGKTALAASVNLKTRLKFTTNVEEGGPKIILDLPCIEFNHSFHLKDLRELFKKQEVPLLNDAPHRTFSLNSPDSINFDKHLEIAKSFLLSQNLPISSSQESAVLSFLSLFWGMFSSVDVPLPNCLIKVTSELDIGAGMGSSTAYNISLASAFLQYIRRYKLKQLSDPCEISKQGYKSFVYCTTDLEKFEKEELDLISRWGRFGDKIMHGNPSGIDNAVCTYGSVIEFRKGTHGPDIKIIPDPRFLKILLVNTKIPRNTRKLVSNVASFKNRYSCIVEPILLAMDSVALTAAEVLRRMSQIGENYDPPNSNALEETLSKEIGKLEELIDVNQKLLEALGVSHDTLEQICHIAKSEGLHGKLTGAGGGGYAFVLLPFRGYDKQLCAVKMSYEKNHFPVQQVTLGGPGVTLIDSSLSRTYEQRRKSDFSTIPSTPKSPTHDFNGKISSDSSETDEQKAQPKDEDLEEWPWPFDLREVVKNMFETQIKEDLQGGEIAIPLQSLCAVNVPEPLPQWMDKITELQDRIASTWKNALQEGLAQRWKMQDQTKDSQFGTNKILRAAQKKLQDSTAPITKPGALKSNVDQLVSPTAKGQRTSKRISIDVRSEESDSKAKPTMDAEYYIPKQASYGGKSREELSRPSKWLKDQFPPYGNREWKYGADLDESSRQLQNLQRKHKKFLKHMKPGCDHFKKTCGKDS
ncbi:hypothetical protein R5R35_006370 [Gryllus longicercus]|uniref:GHMP kinase C-terminal domain-containing protein n=2 Tax=Gryllus longicercus TaxID=2509291 RepID=A0AAN9ZHI8_9ORTH